MTGGAYPSYPDGYGFGGRRDRASGPGPRGLTPSGSGCCCGHEDMAGMYSQVNLNTLPETELERLEQLFSQAESC